MTHRKKNHSDGADSATDHQLVARVADKDRAAFDSLYRQYQPRLLRFLLRITKQPEMAQEVVNDVMFVVWQKAATYRGQAKVSTWIFGIAYLKALKTLKSAQRHSLRNEEDPMKRPDSRPEPHAEVEMADWMKRGLDRLSPEKRLVVELTYYLGCSYREIADIAGCPVNTVKTRMFHARRQLKEDLTDLAGFDQ